MLTNPTHDVYRTQVLWTCHKGTANIPHGHIWLPCMHSWIPLLVWFHTPHACLSTSLLHLKFAPLHYISLPHHFSPVDPWSWCVYVCVCVCVCVCLVCRHVCHRLFQSWPSFSLADTHKALLLRSFLSMQCLHIGMCSIAASISKRQQLLYLPLRHNVPAHVHCRQAFAAVQASIVHLQGMPLARRFALVPLGPPLLSYSSSSRVRFDTHTHTHTHTYNARTHIHT
jgi:hypothetical protein